MKQYLDLLQDILNNGTERDDRTGVGTISVFGRQLRFNMQDGFPAVTTKALAWKAVVSELLWFLEGSTNEHRLAEIKNDNKPYAELTEKERRTIWTDNFDKQGRDLGYVSGYLGGVYGKQWAKLYSIDFNKYQIVENQDYNDTYKEPVFRKLDVEVNEKDKLVGKVFKTNNGDGFIVISRTEKHDNRGHYFYIIQFLKTLSIKSVQYGAIVSGAIKDDYAITASGIGKIGYIAEEDKKQPLYKILHKRWSKMLERCYNPQCKEFACYGAKGVKVCKRWHTFANFLDDVGEVYGFDLFVKEPESYQIDKDILSGNMYSKETCVFIPKYYNQRLINSKPLIYKNQIYLNIEDFCEKNDWASKSGLRHHLLGRFTPKYKDVHRLDIPNNCRVSYELRGINQIKNVIEQIKTNPTSRRLLVSAWNAGVIDQMALPPCHYAFQFYVDGDKLSLMYQMRSNDLFLGCPFNIASYALLLHIVAKITGKVPHELIASLGDCHIYKNHIEQVKEQLSRTPHKLPKLELPANADYSNIDSFLKSVKTSDFKLVGYEHDGAIKAPMAV